MKMDGAFHVSHPWMLQKNRFCATELEPTVISLFMGEERCECKCSDYWKSTDGTFQRELIHVKSLDGTYVFLRYRYEKFHHIQATEKI